MYDIRSMDRTEISELMQSLGEPRFRADQLWRWTADGARSFGEMTNLPAPLREKLSACCRLTPPEVLAKQVSRDGTVKLLWGLYDGASVESVVMRYRHGSTVCISTQVGCRMGCAFCASTRGGRVRDLTPGEILDEVQCSERESGEKISNIVLMGIGEPLDNFENVIKFLRLVGAEEGAGIGMRHISLSTCGPAGGIERLAELDLQLTLSVSLHAPDDETRSRLMPVNRTGGGVKELIRRCSEYRKKTGRRVSYEYLLADGVNDSDAQAEALASLLAGSDGHVNLIPLNHVDGSMLEPSPPERVARFKSILERRGVNVTVRRKMGADIDAACGQLRRRRSAEERTEG